VRIYVAATKRSGRQSYGAMFAFGDSVLFMAVFGLAACPGDGRCALLPQAQPRVLDDALRRVARRCFHQPRRLADLHCANGFQFTALLVGARSGPDPGCAGVRNFSSSSSGLFAPNRSARIALIAATTIELGVLACARHRVGPPVSSLVRSTSRHRGIVWHLALRSAERSPSLSFQLLPPTPDSSDLRARAHAYYAWRDSIKSRSHQ